MLRRIRSACRTNGPQSTALAAMTAMTLMSCGLREPSPPWWAWLGAGLLWPLVAFGNNLINPLPPADESADPAQKEE